MSANKLTDALRRVKYTTSLANAKTIALEALAEHDAQPAAEPQQPVACVVDLDGEHSYLCWKHIAVDTYSDRPQRDLVYAAMSAHEAKR